MRRELDEALVAKYPLIFRDRHENMQHTAMCWGLECGDGWYNIINTLCRYLTNDYNRAKNYYEDIKDKVGQGRNEWSKKIITQEEIDTAKVKLDEETLKVPIAVQVKEKFGGLRFYVQAATKEHYNYISFAESMSYCTCEECGAPGKPYVNGWHVTLCDIHAEMSGKTEEYESDEGDE